MTITHISTMCTSCDWMPNYECEKFKDGTFPLCCPNLEQEVKDAIKERRNEEQ